MKQKQRALPLAARIAGWREHREMTRPEVARKLGVTRQAVGAWERGESPPTQDNLEALARLLGVTMSQFYGEVPQ